MQKLLFVLAVSALVFSSCGTKKAEHKEGAHVHEDGTVHEAHEHDAPAQEAFEVKEGASKDSTKECSKECSKECAKECAKDSCDAAKKEESEQHEHDHDSDHDHDHK